MPTPIPAEALRLIQEFEGCGRLDPADGLLHAYADPLSGGEPFTIGWGTTVYPDGRRVRAADAISRAEADACFAADVEAHFWIPLGQRLPHWQAMHPLMQACLCSFAYNLGADFYGADGFATISACLRERRWSDLPDALMLYVNPGSSVEAGLRRRREAEADLWRQGLSQLAPGAPLDDPQILVAVTETFLKKQMLDSRDLSPHQLVPVQTHRQWKIERILQSDGQSQQVRLAYGAGDWWIYRPHWRELNAPLSLLASSATPASASGSSGSELSSALQSPVEGRDLAVPYLSQLDNQHNPYGSCNVTCVAMCLHYLGYASDGRSRLADDLYQRMEQLDRDRHDPYDLQCLIAAIPGYHDIFRVDGGFQDIRNSIDAGHPVILHGYFTRSGHIVVIRGYDARGFWVNDPYGEWFPDGYDTSRSGERLHYSCELIARTCSPESAAQPANLWFHTVFRL